MHTRTIRKGIHGPRWRNLLLTGVMAITCFGATVGDTLYVGRRELLIRGGKFAFDKVLGAAKQGDTVKVTGVEGKYLKVIYTPKDSPPVEGYVLETALTAEQPVIATTRAAEPGHDALVSVASGKGVLDSKQFASAKGLSQAPLQTMEKQSADLMSASDDAFIEFMKAGKIGSFKPQPGANQ